MHSYWLTDNHSIITNFHYTLTIGRKILKEKKMPSLIVIVHTGYDLSNPLNMGYEFFYAMLATSIHLIHLI